MANRVVAKVLIVLLLGATLVAPSEVEGQGGVQPTNSLPNPYRTIENYFKMPDGRTWGSTSAVEIDKDGRSIWVGERCGANTCAGSDLPSILKFDASGKLGKEFSEPLWIFPHGIFCRPRRQTSGH